MSVTVKFSCGECRATVEGTTYLRKGFRSFSGRDYGFGSTVWRTSVEDVVPEGWVAFDPYTHCCYCPECWKGIVEGVAADAIEGDS